jgi:hypothetical protein
MIFVGGKTQHDLRLRMPARGQTFADPLRIKSGFILMANNVGLFRSLFKVGINFLAVP